MCDAAISRNHDELESTIAKQDIHRRPTHTSVNIFIDVEVSEAMNH